VISIRDLWRVRHVVRISELARRAGIDPRTMHTRIARQTQLNLDDSAAIEQALSQLGIKIEHQYYKNKKAAE